MTFINTDLFNEIEQFLNWNCENNKLTDIRNLSQCKKYLVKIINDVSRQNEEKARIFGETYFFIHDDSFYGTAYFMKVCKDYLLDTSLDIYSEKLVLRLEEVIKNSTYFPVKKELINKVDEFLKAHKDNKKYIDDTDKKLCETLYNELEDAIFNPIRQYDKDFDSKLNTSLKDPYSYLLYLYEVGKEIGRDQNAESKLCELYLVRKENEDTKE